MKDYEILLHETVDIEQVAAVAAAPGSQPTPWNVEQVDLAIHENPSHSVMRRALWSHDDFGVNWGCSVGSEVTHDEVHSGALLDAVFRLQRNAATRGALLHQSNALLLWQDDRFWVNSELDPYPVGQSLIDQLTQLVESDTQRHRWATEDEFWNGLLDPEDTNQIHQQSLDRLVTFSHNDPASLVSPTDQPLADDAVQAAFHYERQLNRYNYVESVAANLPALNTILSGILQTPPSITTRINGIPIAFPPNHWPDSDLAKAQRAFFSAVSATPFPDS